MMSVPVTLSWRRAGRKVGCCDALAADLGPSTDAGETSQAQDSMSPGPERARRGQCAPAGRTVTSRSMPLLRSPFPPLLLSCRGRRRPRGAARGLYFPGTVEGGVVVRAAVVARSYRPGTAAPGREVFGLSQR